MPTVQVNGTELFYRDAGDPTAASVVVLLHAFPLHSGMWARQIAALERRHRVVAPDYRGLGGSKPSAEPSTLPRLAEDVRELLAHLRVERAAVVGLSMGGYLAFELYRQAPALFRGLMLADTKAGADDDAGKAAREKFAQTTLEKGLEWVADEMIPKLLSPDPDPAVAREVRELIRRGTPAGVAAAQRGIAQRADSRSMLGSIACPTLVVVGDHDGLTPVKESQAMAKAIPGAKLVKIPGAGHLSNLENPEAFNRALVEFVEGLAA
jgi:pimeloyl-ACP methyl ester carboxylesterase